VVVALGTVDGHSHWRALRQLVEMLNVEEVRDRIGTARTKETLLQLIAQNVQETLTPNTKNMSQLTPT
jgi:mannitol/fructose-specific phosphotransferase system IIA component (Ntr-type)